MDTEDYEVEESNLVKDLRKQLRDAQNARKQFEEELTELRSKSRERSVSDILSAKGLNPKVAKFVPADVDGEDAISAWLEENGELFGASTAGSDVAQESPVSAETRSDLSRANALQERGVSPDRIADFEQRIANANSVEELNSTLAEYQKYQL